MVSLKEAHWYTVKFGDVVKNANLVERDPLGAGIERIVGLEHLASEDLHIRRWNNAEEGTSFTRKFVPGQTLFGKRRAYQRKVAFAKCDGICSGDILTFESKDETVLLPELLPFICQTDAFFEYALGTSAGSLSPRTSWKALKEFKFSLPPMEEQKRIAEILWAADTVCEKYYSAQNVLSVLGKALIMDHLGNKNISLGDLGDWVGGGTPSKRMNEYWSGNIPWVSPKDLKNRDLSNSIDHITDLAVRNSTTRVVPQGSILVAFRTGILRHTLPVVISRKEVAINQDLKALLPNSLFVSEYVADYLIFRGEHILRDCVKSGTTVESIDFDLFKNFQIPLPDLDTQYNYIYKSKQVRDNQNNLIDRRVQNNIFHKIEADLLKLV